MEPILLGEAKSQCRVTGDDEDGLIAGYILAARMHVENSTRRRLITQVLNYTIDYRWPLSRCGLPRLALPVAPVSSVTSITYVDANGATQTLAVDQYTTALDRDDAVIEPAHNVTWPDVRCQLGAITVLFVAGSSLGDVPHPLKQAMRLLIAHAYDNREAITAGQFNEVPMGVEAYLSPYRVSRFS
jgi:uncharacterized phiE125 gp8 family phage protein